MLSLLTTFPIAWPAIFVTLFKVGGAITVLGTHLVNLKCLSSDNISEADIFFQTRLMWAVLPPALSLACAVCWCSAQKISPKTWKPKLRASVVALLYLVWPGICSEVFTLFACRSVCGELRLRADLDEMCFAGRHADYVIGLGLPMMLLYVLGMPHAGVFARYHA